MRTLVFLLATLPAFVTAAEVYRWVDKDGIVHFSDRPQEGAETIVIPDAQTFSAPPPRSAPRTAAANGGDEEEAAGYENFEIVSPKQEEVFWNIGGELDVSLRSRPRIRSGHEILLFMDGQEVQKVSRGRMRARLTDVVRGTHSLRAEVRDRGGATVATTPAVQFTVQQQSVLSPTNPNNAPVATPLPSGPGG